MKRLSTFLLALLLVSPSSLSASPDGHDSRPMNVEDTLALRSPSQVTVSPDGSRIAYVVSWMDFDENTGESDLWIAPTDGGAQVRMTYHAGRDDSPRWAPDGSWLAFRSARGESPQVYGISPSGGEAWPVTSSATGIDAFEISPDGRWIAFAASEPKTEAQKDEETVRGRPIVWEEYYADQWSRLWVAPLHDHRAGAARRISPDDLQVSSFVWRPDSKAIAFGARPSPALRTYIRGALYVVDRGVCPCEESGATTADDEDGDGGQEDEGREEGQQGELDADDDAPVRVARLVANMPGGESPVAWHPDHGLVFSGTGHELGTYNSQLWTSGAGSGDDATTGPVSLTAAIDENSGFVALTDESLFVESSRRTGRGLARIPLSKGTVSGPPEDVSGPGDYRSGFSASADGSTFAFVAQSAATPPDVWVWVPRGGEPRRVTDLNPQVMRFELGDQRVVRWESRADGEPIEGVLTLPAGHLTGEAAPLLLVIHGGPSGVSADTFAARRGAYPIQVFAGMGYAVLQPNYRGSTGYGERFRGLNRGDISGRDWIDIDSGVDALIERGIADPERLGIMGWSFGGHHTFWGITQTDRYRAASAGAGANDLISMYSQTDLPEFYQTYLGPKPWEDFDLYEERSAYRFVQQVRTPLLIQVGERDERVPAEQSIQFYEALRSIGEVETRLILYPGQPHGVREPRLMRDLVERNVEWFRRWIPLE